MMISINEAYSVIPHTVVSQVTMSTTQHDNAARPSTLHSIYTTASVSQIEPLPSAVAFPPILSLAFERHHLLRISIHAINLAKRGVGLAQVALAEALERAAAGGARTAHDAAGP
jgi:hypothetical protein